MSFSKQLPHPLQPLTISETHIARDIVLNSHKNSIIDFRAIALEEPLKAELQPFLDLESKGKLDRETKRPARLARANYDVIGSDKVAKYCESLIDVVKRAVIDQTVVEKPAHAALTLKEFDDVTAAVAASPVFQEEVAKLSIPKHFEVVVEPWPYGGPDEDEDYRRYFQALCFANDTRAKNPDSNFYAYPLPLIPIMDARTKEIIRVDHLATGGSEDGLSYGTSVGNLMDRYCSAEYVPELLSGGLRQDLKQLNVVQPDGPSFKITDGSLVEWQKWRFRVGFNYREGATLHDIRYDGRSVIYRLSLSEMTVPYADPRAPFHRKQAFDFGDGGAGICANNLELGCDCLGHIKYFDSVNTASDGTATVSPNVVCMHEQDNGIAWKHSNWRTGRAVVTRHRELVIQFIITLANYEYIFAYKFDQAGGVMVEVRATGIVSVVSIDAGKTSAYGNVVSPGVLAQNHQHIFAVRIDPAVDGAANTVVTEESHAVPTSAERNPRGNFYEVVQNEILKSTSLDAAPQLNRVIKMINPNIVNPISGHPVGYKFTPMDTQLLLAQPDSIQARRAQFAKHHVWVTKYRDGELYAGGRYTLQSKDEIGGVSDAVKRNEDVTNTDVVVWSCFGLTHNPRVEDWPVMPVDIMQLHIKPADFFTANPALDVPSNRNLTSTLIRDDSCCSKLEPKL
ncbi:related to peroxisomal amine oxidase (copper-containing) [Rhynchosporium secalis]|uniref:Amine oxidase n=1 Tax=Rhynchosporium secalis TaxID=38038 RepID=A0A1E1MCA7_RHYSE|nr:related to peroxisomal amine oxidase (copper-containing) [Rhynchosporium secalis]